jgi:hypothetical protein
MRNDGAWIALQLAAERLRQATDEFLAHDTGATRSALDAAADAYVARLLPLVGEAEATGLHAAWQRVVSTTDWLEALLATIAGHSTIRPRDLEAVRRASAAQDAATRRFEWVTASLRALVEAAGESRP